MNNENNIISEDEIAKVEKLTREIRLNFETIQSILAKDLKNTKNGSEVFNLADTTTAMALKVLHTELDENKVPRPVRNI